MKLKLNLETIKEKALDIWDGFTTKLAQFVKWCSENKEMAFTLLTTVVALMKLLIKAKNNRKEDEWRSRRFYDRRTDRWCYAKKKPTKKQESMIEERYRDGESYREILDSMNLLK
jgi:hypothetical protein